MKSGGVKCEVLPRYCMLLDFFCNISKSSAILTLLVISVYNGNQDMEKLKQNLIPVLRSQNCFMSSYSTHQIQKDHSTQQCILYENLVSNLFKLSPILEGGTQIQCTTVQFSADQYLLPQDDTCGNNGDGPKGWLGILHYLVVEILINLVQSLSKKRQELLVKVGRKERTASQQSIFFI